MSTVDYKTALAVASGEYPEDNWGCIIIYCNMFGGISFKLCQRDEQRLLMLYFENCGWNPLIVWQDATGYDGDLFSSAVKIYRAQFPNKVMS